MCSLSTVLKKTKLVFLLEHLECQDGASKMTQLVRVVVLQTHIRRKKINSWVLKVIHDLIVCYGINAPTFTHHTHTHALTHAPITFLKFYQFFENFTAYFDHIHSQLFSLIPLIYIVLLVPNFMFSLFLSNPLIPVYVANIFIGLRPFTEMWSAKQDPNPERRLTLFI